MSILKKIKRDNFTFLPCKEDWELLTNSDSLMAYFKKHKYFLRPSNRSADRRARIIKF